MNKQPQQLPIGPKDLRAPLWDTMDRRPHRRATNELQTAVPKVPGVYAWYHHEHAVYVGKGNDLHDRIWRRHMGQSRSLHTSAFRRNIAEYLGFGSAQEIYNKKVRLDDSQLKAVRTWILECEVAWVECDTASAACELETRMKQEWLPPLTKR